MWRTPCARRARSCGCACGRPPAAPPSWTTATTPAPSPCSPRSTCWRNCPGGASPCWARCGGRGPAEGRARRRGGGRPAACADLVLVVGERARPLYEAAATAGSEARFFNAPEDALPVLRDELKPGDHVLIKASRAVALGTLGEALVSP